MPPKTPFAQGVELARSLAPLPVKVKIGAGFVAVQAARALFARDTSRTLELLRDVSAMADVVCDACGGGPMDGGTVRFHSDKR